MSDSLPKHIEIAYVLMLDPAKLPLFNFDKDEVREALKFLEKYVKDKKILKEKAGIAKDGLGFMNTMHAVAIKIQNNNITDEEAKRMLIEAAQGTFLEDKLRNLK